ncbi:MAG: acyl-CoA reductase [Chitinophagales bacterium]|nr:acyl-CoA reductase [Chitinophagales bacterium]
MNLMEYKIERLQELKEILNPKNPALEDIIRLAEIKNKWFSKEHIEASLAAIRNHFLDPTKLEAWLASYQLKACEKKLGLILAGNIPLVGFHDLLCAFLVNAEVQVKLSSKDEVLMGFIIKQLKELDITWKASIVDRLAAFDAVIATGSDNSNRYFEQYFSKVPHILRKNRSSIAVLNGTETAQDLHLLAKDIFMYFGLGCRNVSKLFLPKGYDIASLFPYLDNYKHFAEHNLYKDNYDYNRTLLLMNLEEHLANDFLMVKEDPSLHSRLATIHYSFYKNETEVQDYIIKHHEELQVVVSKPSEHWKSEPFGKSQEPELADYADHIDTLQFLLSL